MQLRNKVGRSFLEMKEIMLVKNVLDQISLLKRTLSTMKVSNLEDFTLTNKKKKSKINRMKRERN